MLIRHIVAVAFSFLLATSLYAYDRGNVLLEYRSEKPSVGPSSTYYELWVHFGWRYTVATGIVNFHKYVPFDGPGHVLIPAPNQVVFHHENTVAMWDGVLVPHNAEGKGYVDLFTSDAELSEIAPMRSGNFLVAQRRTTLDRDAKLIEFNARGKVAEYRFPTLPDRSANVSLGAMHIELLADQCTVLYTLGADEWTETRRVRRMNICTNEPQPDFATLPSGPYAGAIRQLPNGDVLVANGTDVLHFTPEGALRRMDYFPGVTHIALTTDGAGFWAAGVHLGQGFLRSVDLRSPFAAPTSIQIGNDGFSSVFAPVETNDLVTVGEWRAGAARAKARAARR